MNVLRVLVCVLLLWCFYIPQSLCVQSNSSEDTRYTRIKVGILRTGNAVSFSDHYNLDMYFKDRLKEIGQTNHWRYDFIDVSPDEALTKLNQGELDFVFPEIPETFEDDNYLFSERGVGFSLLSLYCREDDTSNNIYSSLIMNTKTLGYFSNEWMDPLVDYYLKKNNWTLNVVKYNDSRQMMRDLKNGVIDLVIADGTRQDETWVKVIDRINVLEDSIMTSKNNKPLIDALNSAVFTTEVNTPDFESWLRSEYIEPLLRDISRYNEAELQFIKVSKPLKVVFAKEMKPLIFVDKDNEITGVYAEIIRLLREESGMKFDILMADSSAQVSEMLNDGRANIIFSIKHDLNDEDNGGYISNIIHKELFVAVAKRGRAVTGYPKVAVFDLFSGISEFLGHKRYEWTIRPYDSIRECLDKVRSGDVDFAVLPKSMIYSSSVLTLYPDLDEIQGQVAFIPLCMSIYHDNAKIIKNIIDVASLKLDEKIIIQKNIEKIKPEVNLAFLLSKYAVFVIALVMIILTMIGFTVVFMIRNSIHKRQNHILQVKNTELEQALRTAERLRISRDSYRTKAQTDGLTGLYNKIAIETFGRERDSLNANAENHKDALIMIDVDHFKEINDTYGHKKGDELLKAVAAILSKVFRNTDKVGRFGGDEFVILMEDVQDNTPFDRIVNEIRSEIRGILRQSGVENLTLSVGIALSPKDGRDYDEVFASADKALYEVKVQGRDGYCIAGGKVIH